MDTLVPPYHGHVPRLDRIGVGPRWQRLLADRAERHLEEIRQHLVTLALPSQIIENLEELLP